MLVQNSCYYCDVTGYLVQDCPRIIRYNVVSIKSGDSSLLIFTSKFGELFKNTGDGIKFYFLFY